MRCAFLGTPDFAVHALSALHDAGHDIACVYTQPPRPVGRSRQVAASPVQRAAEAHGLPVRHPARLRATPEEWSRFAALELDVAVVCAYGLILPESMLAAPMHGCLNIHASLLPRWRGAAPIQAAILAGDDTTGVTIMQMDAGLDTGAMLLAEAIPIGPRDDARTLHDRLATLGASLLLRALAERPAPLPQPERGATYAPKLGRVDAEIDWSQDAAAIDRRIRAFTPWPGSTTTLDGAPLKLIEAHLVDLPRPLPAEIRPGAVLDAGLTIACGGPDRRTALRLDQVQSPGKKPMPAEEFLRGRPVAPGARLGRA